MSIGIIVTVCLLLLLAYAFDISSHRTRIPSVILLLLLGWTVRQAVDLFHIHVPDLSPLLPILGTIGLILIVLEGSLELELDASKLSVIKRSSLNALVQMLVLAVLLAFVFQYVCQVSYKTALINTIPFCVISSAIAIPSVRNLSPFRREFVIYESSLSDIFGVLFFNFIALNEVITVVSFEEFILQLLLMILISFCAVLGLSYLLSRIKHHITYTPIILMVILIYAVSKVYHLPGLIFILIFGLFLSNLDTWRHWRWMEKLHPEKLDREVKKFKEITQEATFLVRSLFFILFGFLVEAREILNLSTIPWAVGIVLLIFLIRWAALKFSKLPAFPLLFVAPRGLITILLFLAIPVTQSMTFVNKSLIIQTIILSVLLMMFGLMATRKHETDKTLH